MNNNQNTATRLINICLLLVCFGAFTMLNSYVNKEKSVSTQNIVHTIQLLDDNSIPVQTSTNVLPDYFQFWIGIDSCNKHYISDIRNKELFVKLAFNTEFRLLKFRYLELKQIFYEDHFYYLIKNNKTDYSIIS